MPNNDCIGFIASMFRAVSIRVYPFGGTDEAENPKVSALDLCSKSKLMWVWLSFHENVTTAATQGRNLLDTRSDTLRKRSAVFTCTFPHGDIP